MELLGEKIGDDIHMVNMIVPAFHRPKPPLGRDPHIGFPTKVGRAQCAACDAAMPAVVHNDCMALLNGQELPPSVTLRHRGTYTSMLHAGEDRIALATSPTAGRLEPSPLDNRRDLELMVDAARGCRPLTRVPQDHSLP